jgi:hypothetical protein
MSNKNIPDLYELLPVFYRLRDAEQGFPLRALLELVSGQADILKRNIDGLWDDLFIETCADWVIPYVGDLVANNPLYEAATRRRADVAKTIYYRRRKATLPMLEELARDVTGWPCHAVAFFELLGWNQNLNHLRFQTATREGPRDPPVFDRVGTVNLRNLDAIDEINRAFDVVCHTVDVRPVSNYEGWYNIRNIGFFLWRLRSYPLTGITPRQASVPHGFHFSTLGNPSPLFNKPQREADPTGLATEIHVPDAIRPVAFFFDLSAYKDKFAGVAASERPLDTIYYGPLRSLNIIRDGVPIPPIDVVCKDLSTFGQPTTGIVAVDVKLGRLSFAAGEEPQREVIVAYNYGFSADMGGGPYDRRRLRAEAGQFDTTGPDTVNDPSTLDALILVPSPGINTLTQALAAWNPVANPRTVIQINDNRTYEENLTINMAGVELVIQGANSKRPTLIGDVTINGAASDSRLAFNGLLIAGAIDLQGTLGELSISHCTLVPGKTLDEDGLPVSADAPSLTAAAGNDRLDVRIDHSILGGLRIPPEAISLNVRDSIVQVTSTTDTAAITGLAAPDLFGPPTTLERTTVFGTVHVKELTLASEVIFTQNVAAERRQSGCVRFSFVPNGSITPRRYRCQPDLALGTSLNSAEKAKGAPLTPPEILSITNEVLARLLPSFTSTQYGHPAYGQLHLHCPIEIATGAEDGSEMGAFSLLKQPQRETNLRIRLDEYLSVGLQPGIIYVT